MNRREFIRRMVVASALGLTGVAAIAELLTREGSPQQAYQISTSQIQSGSQTSTSQQIAPAGYVLIGPTSGLTGKSQAYFTHPTYGNSVIFELNGEWRAFSATCTHEPCTVQYAGNSTIYCPCHGATFNANDGAVTRGPAPTALPEYGVQILNGDIYVSTKRIN